MSPSLACPCIGQQSEAACGSGQAVKWDSTSLAIHSWSPSNGTHLVTNTNSWHSYSETATKDTIWREWGWSIHEATGRQYRAEASTAHKHKSRWVSKGVGPKQRIHDDYKCPRHCRAWCGLINTSEIGMRGREVNETKQDVFCWTL
jgi:hypothetical protein